MAGAYIPILNIYPEDMKGIERLDKIRDLNTQDLKFINSDIYRLLYKEDLYVIAYERMKSNPAATTSGITTQTLDGFSLSRIKGIIDEMKDESFQFSPAKRIYIPKPGTKKMRPLGLPSSNDKVVQEVMRLILESIFEPIFLDCSHGFRPNRSCHTALSSLKIKFKGIQWVCEGDIKGAFDNVDHEILLQILSRKISDNRFMDLIRKALNAGYIEEKFVVIKPLIGTPQGSIISPILSNIYFHELDVFVQEVKNEYITQDKDKKLKFSSEYAKCIYKISRLEKEIHSSKSWIDNHKQAVSLMTDASDIELASNIINDSTFHYKMKIKELKQLKIQRTKLKVHDSTTKTISVQYIRYADNWVIGCNGPKSIILEIYAKLENFLYKSLRLTLNETKTGITRFDSKPILFLGYNAKIARNKKILKKTENGRNLFQRTTGHLVKLTVPMQRVIDKLVIKGLCDKDGCGCSKASWTVHEDVAIVKAYSQLVYGLINYYSLADYRNQLHRIYFILRTSCAKTLARRHRTSVKSIFVKHGKSLSVSSKSGKTGFPSANLVSTDFNKERLLFPKHKHNGFTVWDPFSVQLSLRSKSKLGISFCVICGTRDEIQMHHVKHIRTAQPPKSFTQLMSRVNRKQIPVCGDCHSKIHNGTYDGMKLSDLSNTEDWTSIKNPKISATE